MPRSPTMLSGITGSSHRGSSSAAFFVCGASSAGIAVAKATLGCAPGVAQPILAVLCCTHLKSRASTLARQTQRQQAPPRYGTQRRPAYSPSQVGRPRPSSTKNGLFVRRRTSPCKSFISNAYKKQGSRRNNLRRPTLWETALRQRQVVSWHPGASRSQRPKSFISNAYKNGGGIGVGTHEFPYFVPPSSAVGLGPSAH